MEEFCRCLFFISVLFIMEVVKVNTENVNSVIPQWTTTDELENHINPEDLKAFENALSEDNNTNTVTRSNVDCFGLGFMMDKIPWIFNMQADSSEKVKTHFYLSSRRQPKRVQVWPGKQFGLEWVDFKPSRKTVMIVHGFMSHSDASWVTDMADAFLKWGDLNVIAVDWSGGGNTWKYWRAVANTRIVGSDITRFLKQLMNATGTNAKDFHFVGHSLGAHISSFAAHQLGGVSRITGLDPAQLCFVTNNPDEVLDVTDADYVDVIHTNGRLLQKIGFGLPKPIGHADFYPNGGMKQPGCARKNTFWNMIQSVISIELTKAICSHGRAYFLFTESLLDNKCNFRAHQWNLTYQGVNASLEAPCNIQKASCALMGIDAIGRGKIPQARGPYFVVTTEKKPYCPPDEVQQFPRLDLLRDLKEGFLIEEQKDTIKRLSDTISSTPRSRIEYDDSRIELLGADASDF